MMRSTGKIILLALCAVAIVSQGLAQQDIKVGVVDSMQVLEKSTEGKKMVAQLEEINNSTQKKIAKMDEDIRQLETRLNTQRLTLTDEALMNLTSDIERKRTDRARFAEDSSRTFVDTRNRLFARLQNEVRPIIAEIGKERNLEIIFDKNNSGAIYFSPSIDLTAEVIVRYDASKAPTKK